MGSTRASTLYAYPQDKYGPLAGQYRLFQEAPFRLRMSVLSSNFKTQVVSV
jgi:hypothetical protein